MTEQNFDVVVIGGGPGGYVAAIRAAQLGMKAAVVEANHLGGICLNWGCIPTKALLRSAEVFHLMNHANEFGLSCENPSFDIKKIVERSRAVSKQLAGGVGHLLKKNKVTVFDAYGRLQGKGKVEIEKKDKTKEILSAKHIIVATGARAGFAGIRA
jgi:dihydrolipoamide dehydrogenase